MRKKHFSFNGASPLVTPNRGLYPVAGPPCVTPSLVLGWSRPVPFFDCNIQRLTKLISIFRCGMARYLHDASQQAAITHDLDLAGARFRHRHLSSSTGSHDFEYLSTSSVSSPSHEPQDPQPDAYDDFSEEFESIAIRRRLSDNTASANDEMYWKEIGAALALTTLARSNVTK
ncbi:homeobox protein Mohawk [Elysia marginata]|uniref:Homeobox protein Mohawk n=1 Tax=Elysia marginata TaxID=1093978 RepID=A0AAV4J0Q9_9GAST|nr:homeobox protein Mohawk [Elysia marginata]